MAHAKVIDGRHYGTGKRKNAIARVFLSEGAGTVTVNGRTFENYFPREILRIIAMQPFARCSSLSVIRRFIAPRSLNDPVVWRFSSLKKTLASSASLNAGENFSGVCRTNRRRRPAAADCRPD